MAKHLNKKEKHKRFQKNTRFLESIEDISYNGLYDEPTSIELIQYSSKGKKRISLPPNFIINDFLQEDCVSWFKITGFSDISLISSIFNTCNLERFEIKNLLAGQTTRIEAYPEINYLLMSSPFIEEDNELRAVQYGFIQGKNFLISFHETSMPIINKVSEALDQKQAYIRYKSADLLLCLLLNSLYTQQVETVTKLIDCLGKTEEDLIAELEFSRELMPELRKAKANYRTLRRIISPIHEEMSDLLLNTNGLIKEDNVKYFNDFGNKILSSLSDLEIYNDLIKSSMDLYYSNGNQHMNEIMQRLNIVATIFIPLTFLAGIWGMNFESMSELKWEYGYLFAWGTMGTVALITIWYLRRKKWF